MMKYIKLIVIGVVTLFSSCNDYLDIKPKNMISLETIDDVKSVMSSYFYGIKNNTSYWSQAANFDGRNIDFPLNVNVTTTFMFYADNIKMVEIPNVYYTWGYYEGLYYQAVKWKAYSFANSHWNDLCKNIGYFNLVLDALSKTKNKDSDTYKEVFAEAKMLRTFMFFNLLKFYTPYNNDKYGLPITTSSEAIDGASRSTLTETFAFLLDELKSIEELEFNETEWNIFYSKEKMAALYSQIYWYKAESAAKEKTDWSNAVKYAEVITEKRSPATSEYQLKNIFAGISSGFNENNPYCLLIVSNAQTMTSNISAPWGIGSDNIPAEDELIQLYDSGDIRLKAFFNDKMQVNKWNPNFSVSNINPIWRVAEFHLIAAEAYARMGENEKAEKYLNEFRKSRIPNYQETAYDDLLSEILKERRKELCFEFGSRWLDLKRAGKGFSRIGISDEVANTDDNKVKFILEDNDYRFALPIPIDSELSVNDIEQNPGWDLE